MNQEIITQEQEAETIAQRMAERAGGNTRIYTIMPTITINNKNTEDGLAVGSFIKGIKSESGYSNEICEKPLRGIIIKIRMFLNLKFKYSKGKPRIVTNEFDSYADDEMIFVKEKGLDKDSKYVEVFVGNYKQVNDKYSLKGDTEIEKKLELHHAIYVLLDNGDIVRFDSKGLSRSNFFAYMQEFTRKRLDKISSIWTIFDSEISDTDYNGKKRKTPIAAFKFTKDRQLTIDELKSTEKIQIEFEKQLVERDKMFGGEKIVTEGIDAPVKKELPVIQLEEQEKVATLDLPEEEGSVNIKDIPF